MYFIKNQYPDAYEVVSSWFPSPLAREYFNILDGYLRTGRSIDTAFIENCREVYCLMNKEKRDEENRQ
jgi:hypothetical protein